MSTTSQVFLSDMGKNEQGLSPLTRISLNVLLISKETFCVCALSDNIFLKQTWMSLHVVGNQLHSYRCASHLERRATPHLYSYFPANTERSPNVPEWSHEVIFLGTKQERYTLSEKKVQKLSLHGAVSFQKVNFCPFQVLICTF